MAKMIKYEVDIEGQKFEIEAEETATQAEIEEAVLQQLAAERGIAGDALRKAEFFSRGVLDTSADVLGAIPDLAASGLRQVGLPVPQEGFYTEAIKSGLQSVGRSMDDVPRALGFDTSRITAGPMTTGDESALAGGQGAANAASVFLPITALAKTAKAGTTTANVLTELAKQKAAQTAAGVTGSVVTSATDSPTAGMLSSMAVPFVQLVPRSAKNATVVALKRMGLKEDAPTTDLLKAMKGQAYDAVDDIQGEVKTSALKKFRDNLEPAMEDVGYDKFIGGAPSAVLRSLDRMIKEGTALDLKRVEQIRKRINIAMENSSMKRGDMAIAMKMRDQFDNWFENLTRKDITVGGQEIPVMPSQPGDVVKNTAAEALKTARAANVKFRKSELIEEIIAGAELQPSGLENGLRIGFRSLLKNKKRLKGFTQDERNIMEEIVKGNAITNVARLIGGFGFRVGGGSPNILGGTIGAASGREVGGPAGAVGLPLLGTLSKMATDRLGANTADYLRAMAATGGRDVAPRSSMVPRAGLLGSVSLQNLGLIP